MSSISIIYFTGSRNTGKAAEAASKGATSVKGAETNRIAIPGEDIVRGWMQKVDPMKRSPAMRFHILTTQKQE